MSLSLNYISLWADKGSAPDRVLLLRDGEVGWAGIKGLILDEAGAKHMLAEFKKHGADIPIDYHHRSRMAEKGTADKAPAAGWITGLEYVKGEGLYADVRWTDQARKEIEAEQFKYLSPDIYGMELEDGTKVFRELHSVALTNRPRTIDAPTLLAAAKALESEDDMPKDEKKPDATLEAWKAVGKELRLSAQDEGDVPAVTGETKAMVDLITALQAAGVAIDETASLANVLAEATTFVQANTGEGEGETEETEMTEEETAAKAEQAVKAANYDKLAAAHKDLTERLESIEADKSKARIDALIESAVKDNRLNPNDEKAVTAVREIAETNFEGAKKMLDTIHPYGPSESITRTTGSGDGSQRSKLILSACKEFDSGIDKETGAPIRSSTTRRSWVQSTLQEDGLNPELSKAELATVEGGAK